VTLVVLSAVVFNQNCSMYPRCLRASSFLRFLGMIVAAAASSISTVIIEKSHATVY